MSDTAQLDLEQLQATIRDQAPVPTGTVSFVDRLAMRAGLSLVLWSRTRTAHHLVRESAPRRAFVREHVADAAAVHDRALARVERVQRPIF